VALNEELVEKEAVTDRTGKMREGERYGEGRGLLEATSLTRGFVDAIEGEQW
jgi:hypothetical protein